MMKKLVIPAFSIALAFILAGDLYAQGRGRGGGGRPAGVGGGNSGIGGMERGRGNRADDPFDRARMRRDDRGRDPRTKRERALGNAPDRNELNRYRGISKKLGTTPEALRAQYIEAATLNPDLRFGQFVAANVVAFNLNGRYPGVTTSAILLRMQDGDSLGQALRDLRVDSDTARRAEREAKERIRDSIPRE